MNRDCSGHDLMYSYMWEFHIKRECAMEFERLYGPEGEWVQLFRKGEGYLGTELFRDVRVEGRYVTIDYWITQAAYEAFRERCRDDYEALDERCSALTEEELRLGEFSCGSLRVTQARGG